ncbi:MAG: hypothetical protein WAM60_24470 [Candidatus Promineifilaceae bacterium]
MKTLHRRIAGSFFVAIFLILGVSVHYASAGWMHCRSDPAVILSNGLVMDLSADISAFPWKVRHVDYVLHVPEDVSMVASVSTPTWVTSIETFTVINDAPPGEYHTETTVHTAMGGATVTAHTVLVSALGLHLASASTPGHEGEALHTYLNVP